MRVVDRVGHKSVGGPGLSSIAPTAQPSTETPVVQPTTPSLQVPWAPRTPTRSTSSVSVGDVARSRLEAQTKPPPDGRRFAQQRLDELATLSRLGVPTAFVFDLDNTVFDTRHRTLQAGRAFDEAKGTRFFADVTVDVIGVDGHATARALGLEDPHKSDFVAFWDAFFWTPENLAHDAPIGDMVELARAAQEAGAQVTFLTGRIQSFHRASLDQLRAAGLDVTVDDVVCKPDLATRTGSFKSAWLEQLTASGVEIGFFVTEGARDLTHLATATPHVPLLRLDCSFEDAGHLRHLPTWPGPF